MACDFSKDLFLALRKRNLPISQTAKVGHQEAYEYITMQLNQECTVDYTKPDMFEYVLKKGIHTLESLLDRLYDHALLEIAIRVSGIEEIQKLELLECFLDERCVFCLFGAGYKFNKENIKAIERGDKLYPFMICGVLKYEELNEAQKKDFEEFASGSEIKVSQATLPFLKPVRKQKALAFLLCVNRVLNGRKLPKDLKILLLDRIFSPATMPSKGVWGL